MQDASKLPNEQVSKGSVSASGAVGYTCLHGLDFLMSTYQPTSVQEVRF